VYNFACRSVRDRPALQIEVKIDSVYEASLGENQVREAMIEEGVVEMGSKSLEIKALLLRWCDGRELNILAQKISLKLSSSVGNNLKLISIPGTSPHTGNL